jgi:hypothetical protein
MQKWEYKKIYFELDLSKTDAMTLGPGSAYYEWQDLDGADRFTDEMRRLRQLGNEGWELVAILHKEAGRKFTDVYYFKRPVE